jgi:hypothetical protein
MLMLMVALAMIALIVGPTLLAGQPVLIVLGLALAAALLLVTRRAKVLAARR